jgi:hypothetical protein
MRPTEATPWAVGQEPCLALASSAGLSASVDSEPPQNSRHSGMSLNTGTAQTGGTAPCLDRYPLIPTQPVKRSGLPDIVGKMKISAEQCSLLSTRGERRAV